MDAWTTLSRHIQRYTKIKKDVYKAHKGMPKIGLFTETIVLTLI